MTDRRLDYDKVRFFWRERASRKGKIDPRSITFFCEDPEALAFRDRREKALFDERVSLTGHEKVLEAGCGSGRWTAFLAGRCGALTAFDFAAELVEVNREEAETNGVSNVRFEMSDLLGLDLPERDFDLAVCFGVTLYVNDENLRDAYANLRGHLKDGGTLLVKEPLASGERIEQIDEVSEKLGTRYSCLYRPRAELEGALAGAGFEKAWWLPVYEPGEPLAPQREGIETWFGAWTVRDSRVSGARAVTRA